MPDKTAILKNGHDLPNRKVIYSLVLDSFVLDYIEDEKQNENEEPETKDNALNSKISLPKDWMYHTRFVNSVKEFCNYSQLPLHCDIQVLDDISNENISGNTTYTRESVETSRDTPGLLEINDTHIMLSKNNREKEMDFLSKFIYPYKTYKDWRLGPIKMHTIDSKSMNAILKSQSLASGLETTPFRSSTPPPTLKSYSDIFTYGIPQKLQYGILRFMKSDNIINDEGFIINSDCDTKKDKEKPSKGPSKKGDKSTIRISGKTVCIIGIPSSFSTYDLIDILEPLIDIAGLRLIQDSIRGRYIALVSLKSNESVDAFYKNHLGTKFSKFLPEFCQIVYLDSVTIRKNVVSSNQYKNPQFWGLMDSKMRISTEQLELPTCPICLERMDVDTTGLLAITCQHTYQCRCLSRWGDTKCPVCTNTNNQVIEEDNLLIDSDNMEKDADFTLSKSLNNLKNGSNQLKLDEDSWLIKKIIDSHFPKISSLESIRISNTDLSGHQECFICQKKKNLWMCIICGYVGCSRYSGWHAFRHFNSTNHAFALDLDSQRIWDYKTDTYVHRLIKDKSSGKPVELDDPINVVRIRAHSPQGIRVPYSKPIQEFQDNKVDKPKQNHYLNENKSNSALNNSKHDLLNPPPYISENQNHVPSYANLETPSNPKYNDINCKDNYNSEPPPFQNSQKINSLNISPDSEDFPNEVYYYHSNNDKNNTNPYFEYYESSPEFRPYQTTRAYDDNTRLMVGFDEAFGFYYYEGNQLSNADNGYDKQNGFSEEVPSTDLTYNNQLLNYGNKNKPRCKKLRKRIKEDLKKKNNKPLKNVAEQVSTNATTIDDFYEFKNQFIDGFSNMSEMIIEVDLSSSSFDSDNESEHSYNVDYDEEILSITETEYVSDGENGILSNTTSKFDSYNNRTDEVSINGYVYSDLRPKRVDDINLFSDDDNDINAPFDEDTNNDSDNFSEIVDHAKMKTVKTSDDYYDPRIIAGGVEAAGNPQFKYSYPYPFPYLYPKYLKLQELQNSYQEFDCKYNPQYYEQSNYHDTYYYSNQKPSFNTSIHGDNAYNKKYDQAEMNFAQDFNSNEFCDTNTNLKENNNWNQSDVSNVNKSMHDKNELLMKVSLMNGNALKKVNNNDKSEITYNQKLQNLKGVSENNATLTRSNSNFISSREFEALAVEYTNLIRTQMESQREYYESLIDSLTVESMQENQALETRLESLENTYHFSLGELKIAQYKNEELENKHKNMVKKSSSYEKSLSEEKALNKSLLENQIIFQEKTKQLELELSKKNATITDLEEQLRDLMFSLELGNQISGINSDSLNINELNSELNKKGKKVNVTIDSNNMKDSMDSIKGGDIIGINIPHQPQPTRRRKKKR